MQSRGTVKLIDGFYIGDGSSAQDEDFLLLNHVNSILNCAHPLHPHYYAHYAIRYLALSFPPAPTSPALQEALDFLEEGRVEGGSVLVHGDGDLDSGAGVGAVFLMGRFRWSLFKTLEFLHSRMPQLALHPRTYELLKAYELLLLNEDTRLTYNWQARPYDHDELLLRNTFLNAGDRKITETSPGKVRGREREGKEGKKRVSWVVQVQVLMQDSKTEGSSRRDRQEQSQKSLRNQILVSVRKILKESGNKRQELPTKKSIETIPSLPSPLTLKKHKSSYLLTCIPLLERAQKADSLREKILSAELPSHRTHQDSPAQRMQTESIELLTSPSEKKLRTKENIRTDGSEESQRYRDNSARMSKRQNASLKKGSSGEKSYLQQMRENKQNESRIHNRLLLKRKQL